MHNIKFTTLTNFPPATYLSYNWEFEPLTAFIQLPLPPTLSPVITTELISFL